MIVNYELVGIPFISSKIHRKAYIRQITHIINYNASTMKGLLTHLFENGFESHKENHSLDLIIWCVWFKSIFRKMYKHPFEDIVHTHSTFSLEIFTFNVSFIIMVMVICRVSESSDPFLIGNSTPIITFKKS